MGKPNARERILSTAAALFHERGYCGVGINEIIEKADTAKATFYHHFPTKQALGAAWLQSVHERTEAKRQAILEAGGDPVDKVAGYFDSLGRFLIDHGFRGCPYTNTAAVMSDADTALREQIEIHKRSVRGFFHALAAEFALGQGRAQRVGDALFLLYSGATAEAQNLRTTWPVEAARETALEFCRREAALIAH